MDSKNITFYNQGIILNAGATEDDLKALANFLSDHGKYHVADALIYQREFKNYYVAQVISYMAPDNIRLESIGFSIRDYLAYEERLDCKSHLACIWDSSKPIWIGEECAKSIGVTFNNK